MTKWSLRVVITLKESTIGKQKLRSLNIVLTFVLWVNTGCEWQSQLTRILSVNYSGLHKLTHLTIQKNIFKKFQNDPQGEK